MPRPSIPPKPDYDVLTPSDTWPIYHRATWGEGNERWLVFASRVAEGKDAEHYAWRVKAPGKFHWEAVHPHTTWEEAMEYVRQHIEKKQEQA